MAKLIRHNGAPAVEINGEIFPPMMATIRTNNRDSIIVDKEYYRELGKSGIRIFFLICDTIWLKPNAIELFEEEANALLEVVPDAYIIPRIGLHPTNEWIMENPGEVFKYNDGTSPEAYLFSESYETLLPGMYSLCSQKWREKAGTELLKTWSQIMKLPCAGRIAGCFLAAGGTSEWYYILPAVDEEKGLYGDFSESFKREFGKYLKSTYKTEENLKKQWKNNNVSFENPIIPGLDKHYYKHQVDIDAMMPRNMYANSDSPNPPNNGTNIGSFADFDKNVDVYDFWRAWHIGVADSVLYFADLMKKNYPDMLVGAFYGAYGCTDYFLNGTCGGTVKLLKSKSIDFLASPSVYENRLNGGYAGQRQPFDSFLINNKMYVVEDDTRTHMENDFYRDKYDVYDMTDTIERMKRDFGRDICINVQAWWFDQLLGGRRYKHPEIYKLIERQQKIAKFAYSRDRRKNSEIALIFDEESAQAVSFKTTRDLIEVTRNYEIAHIGAPADEYFHNDMANPDMPSYKLYVFLNTFVLTDEERKVIINKLKKDNAVALWVYAPGIINPNGRKKLCSENIKNLTGINTVVSEKIYHSKFRVNPEAHPMLKAFDKRKLYGRFDRRRYYCMCYHMNRADLSWDSYICPVIYSDDKDAVAGAKFAGSEMPAITIKEMDGWTSVLYGSKVITGDIIKEIARYVGCHIYCESDDVLYANREFITIHASSAGKKELKFQSECSPYELYENKYYGRSVKEISFDMQIGETKMFSIAERKPNF